VYFGKGVAGILDRGKQGIIGVIRNGYPQEIAALFYHLYFKFAIAVSNGIST
jgi:hypothetical protein